MRRAIRVGRCSISQIPDGDVGFLYAYAAQPIIVRDIEIRIVRKRPKNMVFAYSVEPKLSLEIVFE